MKNQNIWIGKQDLTGDKQLVEQSKEEFYELPILNDVSQEEKMASSKSNRRDFLKYLGFGIGAAAIAASCESPIRRAIPYVNKPDAIVPGVANYYATSFVNGKDYLPILVKTREGRPIKIEGNPQSPISHGGTSARAQAMVLELYDSTRFQHPAKVGSDDQLEKVSWTDLDKEIKSKLTAGSNIRILTNSLYSPSTKAAIDAFKETYPNTKVVNYDANSHSAMLLANEKQFGIKAIPSYHFDKVDLVVNFNADFLGTWVSPVEFASQWAKTRKIDDYHHAKMSRMIAFEPHMTFTGANADNRVLIKPSEIGVALALLHDKIASKLGGSTLSVSSSVSESVRKAVDVAAKDLIEKHAEGKGTLVVSGSNNTAEQMIVNHINHMLSAYGNTITWDVHYNTSQAVDKDVLELQKEMNAGTVDAVFVLGNTNPLYSLAEKESFQSAWDKVGLKVAMAVLPSETALACDWVAPIHHNLESWSDAMPKSNTAAIVQPTIAPLFDTRNPISSFLTWADKDSSIQQEEEDLDYTFIKQTWEKEMFAKQSKFQSFQTFWDMSLHDGFVELNEAGNAPSFNSDHANVASKITKPTGSEYEISFYETVNIGAGEYANNPWLQEMPDPLLRTVWDNCLSIPVEWDGSTNINGWKMLENGDQIEITVGDNKIKTTVAQQFGMPKNTFAIAIGYGRSKCGRAGAGVGNNVFELMNTRDEDGNVQWFSAVKPSEKVGVDDTFASVQYHHTFGVKDKDPESGEVINVDEASIVTLSEGFQGSLVKRSIIRHADLADLETAVHDLEHEREHHQYLNKQTLYPGHDDLYNSGHKWELSVDLSACIGCGACQVACISENNVPVVGKHEVRLHHEMTWLRIDRYFYGDFESPNTVYQPMMCQHCDNAPCENVCPVNATNHSSEGLNQMTYNRCIGTRYCANNCPYKVRRFNWLDFTTADLFGKNENQVFDNESGEPFYAENLTRMVLNPDVTVRSRGVIEKCSFCVQRIQEGKLKAKTEMRGLQDGDITTACASACPTGAIKFGDVNNKASEVSKKKASPMNYYVLEEVNTQSSVGYHMKVVNKNEELDGVKS